VYAAFELLSDRRSHSELGGMPIPLSEIVSYLTLYPYFDEDEFVKLIVRMDREYLRSAHEKAIDP
jgi:hypothetical protein